MKEWIQANKGLAIVIGVIIVVALGLILFADPQSSEDANSSISGVINFNGIEPREGGKGEVKVMAREFGTTEEFTDTGATAVISDQVNWVWDSAASGTTYEVKADGYYDGTFVKSSTTATATAPATDVTLTFNVKPEEIPGYEVEDKEVTISGAVTINGYIPNGAIVNVLEKPMGSDAYVVAVAALPAAETIPFSWDEAKNGVEYDIKSEMISAETTVGESTPIRVVAPAENEILELESTAKPAESETPADITGTVKINGAVVQDSTLLMLAKLPEDADYTAFDRIPAVDGATWVFEGASGQSYNITAALQVNEQNVATGNVVTATAPAKDEKIVINSGLSLDAPTSKPKVTCGDPDGTGNYNAAIGLPYVEYAQQYYSTVGTSSGGEDVAKELLKATGNQDVSYTAYVEKDKDYFTQYAYSYCSDCNVSDKQNWSSWSPTTGFKCPQ